MTGSENPADLPKTVRFYDRDRSGLMINDKNCDRASWACQPSLTLIIATIEATNGLGC